MTLLLTITAIGLVLLFGTFGLARRGRRAARVAAVVLAALLCVRAVLAARADWEWALLPWPAYAYVQGFTLPALAAAFFGVAAASLPLRWNRLVVLCVGLAVLGHGVLHHTWLAWPEVHGDARLPGVDHHLRQSSHYTCGPAACAAALSHCGLRASERELASACLTRRDGTRLFDLYRGLVLTIGARPIDVSIEDVDADTIVAQGLVVVGSNAGRGHAICIAASAGGVVVHDPLLPSAQRGSLAQLRAEFRAPAIVLRPRPGGAAVGAAPGR